MIDFSWKVFVQTGNIETYLLMKEMENINDETSHEYTEDIAELDTQM